MDRGTAEDHGLDVGDDLTLLTLAGKEKVTLVGITEFGDSDALDSDGTVSVTEDDAFDWLNSGQAEYESYYLRGSGDPDDLVASAGDGPPGRLRGRRPGTSSAPTSARRPGRSPKG